MFECLQIVLVLPGASTKDFSIFDVDEVFFFTSGIIILLNCDDFSYLPVGLLVLYLFGLFKMTVLLRPQKFSTLFRALISPFSNSGNLVSLAIYIFSILSITVLIIFILCRLNIKHFFYKIKSLFL